MQFALGAMVVHAAYGVSQIVKIELRQFTAGVGESLYYELATSTGTVWVPVTTQAVGGLRSLTALGDLAHYGSVLAAPPTLLHKDHRYRQQAVRESLRQGSFQAVCEVVRDLTASSWQKPLNWLDTASLRRAREILDREWATAAGVSLATAMGVVDALLTQGRQAQLALIAPAPLPPPRRVPSHLSADTGDDHR